MKLEDIQLIEVPENKLKRPPRKDRAVVVVTHPDGHVEVHGDLYTEIAYITIGATKPAQLSKRAFYIAAGRGGTGMLGEDFVLKPQRKGRPKEMWHKMDMFEAKQLGIKDEIVDKWAFKYRKFIYPPHILPSKKKYTDAEVLLRNELLCDGAVWCEVDTGKHKYHFLAVLP